MSETEVQDGRLGYEIRSRREFIANCDQFLQSTTRSLFEEIVWREDVTRILSDESLGPCTQGRLTTSFKNQGQPFGEGS